MDFDGDFLEKEIAPSSVDVKQMNIIYIFEKTTHLHREKSLEGRL